MRYKDPNNVSKQKILLESFKLFATKPFSDITFTDIEKVTGLSRGAILYHFKSKDEILASIIDRFIINKEYGYMVCVRDNQIDKTPLGEVAGRLKTVDPDSGIIKEAKAMGICFGD